MVLFLFRIRDSGVVDKRVTGRRVSPVSTCDLQSICQRVIQHKNSLMIWLGSWNSSRPCVSGGTITQTGVVYRESLCNNNFHIPGYGSLLIICVKNEFEFLKKRRLRG